MAKPLVSILIPAYNAQEWIAETCRSAVAQTWERKEIIVVDDGSSDQTLATVKQFESDCCHVVTQKNQGAAAARNRAYSLSKGDYIQWLDADDLLSPDKIARQMEVLEQGKSQGVLALCGWGYFLYRHSRAKFDPTPLWCDLSPTEFLLRKMERNLHMQTATWLVPRKVAESAGPWNTALLGDDDGEYFCRVLLASDGIRFVPDARVYYRMSPNSLSYISGSDRKLQAQWKSMQLHVRYLLALEDSDRTRAACVRYLHNWSVYFYPERPDLLAQLEQMARDLGGELEVPRLPWKYSWIAALFGGRFAKRAQVFLPRMRWSVARSWDKALFRMESRPGAKT